MAALVQRRCFRRRRVRPCSQGRCTGKHVTTTFRQELIERELPAIPGASTTILRTRSIVLMPIEANVPKQQQEGSANVSSTLFSKLHARGRWTTCAYRKP